MESDEELRKQIIAVAERAKDIQKSISGAVHKCRLLLCNFDIIFIAHHNYFPIDMMDVTFNDDLHNPLKTRTVYNGHIMGFDMSTKVHSLPRVYVQVDDPPVEIKVYLVDLNEQYRVRIHIMRSYYDFS